MTTYLGAEDLDALLEDAGVEVTLGSTTVKALRDERGVDMLDPTTAPIAGTEIVFVIRRGALAGLVEGATLVSEGTTYEVRKVAPVDDGAFVRAACKVSP